VVFGGDFVVDCVVKRGGLRSLFEGLEMCHELEIFLWKISVESNFNRKNNCNSRSPSGMTTRKTTATVKTTATATAKATATATAKAGVGERRRLLG
jgi:hypothetical protein